MPDSTQLTARPTTYNGIAMRSRLEAKYAAWLDSVKANWEYEPRCFATEAGQYLPDFLIRGVKFLESEVDVYVEVKPLLSMFSQDRFREVAAIIGASEPDALFILDAADLSGPVVGMWWTEMRTRCHWSLNPSTYQLLLMLELVTPWREAM